MKMPPGTTGRHVPLMTVAKFEAGGSMSVSLLLVIVLVVILVGAVPAWPHSRSWGYGPSGIAGALLLVFLVLLLLGRV